MMEELLEDDNQAETRDKPKSRLRDIIYAVVIILVAIGVGAGVWIYRQAEIDNLKSANTGSMSEEKSDKSKLIDPDDTAKWSTIFVGPALNEEGAADSLIGVSFRLPIGWTAKNCGGLVAYVSPTQEKQATCNSEGSAPIVIAVQNGDMSSGYDYSDKAIYSDQKSQTVKINGKDFTKTTATIAHPMEFQPPAGSKLVSYFAVINGVTYSASYTYAKGDAIDLTTDFTQLAEQTLVVTTP